MVRRALHGALLTLAALLMSARALAFGTVQLKNASPDEVDKQWKLEMDINYGGQPHMPHIPFDMVFTLTNYFEYSQTDADREPVVRRKPMVNQTAKRESVDIDFADARGKSWPRTKFQIALKRDRDFEAGEYTMVIRRASDGAQMGNSMHITLNGKNDFIDRRAIVFAGPRDAGAKKPAASAEAGAGSSDNPPESTEPKTSTSAEPTDPESEPKAPPAVQKRPGGCGCELVGGPGASLACVSSVGVCFGAVLLRRRRRKLR